MSEIQKELKKWLSDYCGNVEEYEYQVRKLINQKKDLTSKIKSVYSSGDVERVKELIERFLIDEKKIWIETCSNCEKVNYISGKPGERILDRKCEQCSQYLYNDEREQLEGISNKDKIKRTCLYCSEPVSPPNAITCIFHKNVRFEY